MHKAFLLRANGSDATLAPSTNLLTRNPFLLFRLVFFGLLGNFALLSLIFASWNIHSALSTNFAISSSSIFVALESIIFFVCGTLAVVDFFCPRGRMSFTLVECGWVGLLSLWQVGTAIGATISGPPISCRLSPDWSVCASATIIVPIAWLSSLLTLTYFLAIFVAALAHKSLYSDIWKRSVYTIEWFGHPQQLPCEKKIQSKINSEDDPYFDYYEDIESTGARKNKYAIRKSVVESTPWAPTNVRRGVDQPFATKPRSNMTSPTLLSVNLPSIPSRTGTGPGVAGSRYLERFRESTMLSRSEDVAQFMTHYQVKSPQLAHKPSFPPSVEDLDKPIPLTQRSEWVRAGSYL